MLTEESLPEVEMSATKLAVAGCLTTLFACASSHGFPDDDGESLPGRRKPDPPSLPAPPSGPAAAPGGGPPACTSVVKEAGLVAYYPLDEKAGAIVHDCSGNAYDGILASGTWTAGRKNGALAFDGKATCVDLGKPAKLAFQGAFTVTVWAQVLPATTGNLPRSILARTTAPAMGWRIGTRDSSLLAFELGLSDDIYDLDAATDTGWMHVAMVFEPDERAEIYVNGSPEERNRLFVPTAFADDPAAHVRIGCLLGEGYFSGMLDELRIYDRALSEDEIAALAPP
jgi:hypothetical protein